MIRLRRWTVVACSFVAAAGLGPLRGQPPAPAQEKWQLDRAITIAPQPEPQPALKYRLLPMSTDLKEGNAVPIYLRLNHEQRDEARKIWNESPLPWIDLPLDQMPKEEVRKFLDTFGRFFVQFDYGARRKTAEWNYTIEQPDPIGILLPDVQQMRGYTPMMILRTRAKLAENDFVSAARSFETGFAFSRHVANGPFLINGLVGLAIANQFADRIPEWIERPGAPNLYWSLTNLPRPLISLRNQMDFEQRVLEMQFPELADLGRPRSAAEWDATLRRFRAEAKRIYPFVKDEISIDMTDPDEPAAKSSELAAARKYVTERKGMPAAAVEAMPPAQVLLLYIYGSFEDYRDDLFKNIYLPFWQMRPLLAEANARLKSAPNGEGVRLARMFLPAISKVSIAQNRLARKIDMLRTIEALRLHAAAHGGQLPDSLDQLKSGPAPLDAATGKPFEYKRDGATAVLTSRIPGEPLETTGLRYRITMRGK